MLPRKTWRSTTFKRDKKLETDFKQVHTVLKSPALIETMDFSQLCVVQIKPP
jgi:hypothetical protein